MLELRGDILPPTIDCLSQWSRLFWYARAHVVVDTVRHLHEHRCDGTFGNYAASVKLACELEGKSTAVFDHPLLPRTKLAIKKRLLLAPRKPTWVGRTLLERMVPMMIERPFMMEMLVLLLAANVFLLRVPPEGMPMRARKLLPDCPQGNVTTVFRVLLGGKKAELWFPRGKNSLHPTRLIRKRWCCMCPVTCPVHVLGDYLQSPPEGHQPLAHISEEQVLTALRELLSELEVPNAYRNRTHDFGRGRAEDLCKAGGRLCVFL